MLYCRYMKKIHLSTLINVPAKKLWDVMLSEETYKEWTSEFHGGSSFKGNWGKGSTMLFVGPSEDGKGEGGIASTVKENRPYEFLSLETAGFIQNGIIDSSSDAAKEWIGGIESYTFNEKDGGTELIIESEVAEDMFEEMESSWKRALAKLKEIAEK